MWGDVPFVHWIDPNPSRLVFVSNVRGTTDMYHALRANWVRFRTFLHCYHVDCMLILACQLLTTIRLPDRWVSSFVLCKEI